MMNDEKISSKQPQIEIDILKMNEEVTKSLSAEMHGKNVDRLALRCYLRMNLNDIKVGK